MSDLRSHLGLIAQNIFFLNFIKKRLPIFSASMNCHLEYMYNSSIGLRKVSLRSKTNFSRRDRRLIVIRKHLRIIYLVPLEKNYQVSRIVFYLFSIFFKHKIYLKRRLQVVVVFMINFSDSLFAKH